ncbi:ferredoxin-type protein NapF [Thalassotalea ponticola]|uniref:ferredoxin-type protein NapF n=1 Tax=Thalassotalea ponticola TaxID=1523392 RepID=UPI0025B5898B|nr:ferredoxin-type protein NapF [Thalassotalea ponticola]MDN3651887.1 ferredoxin-type protein NapF [Thalassotalea ponticola]
MNQIASSTNLSRRNFLRGKATRASSSLRLPWVKSEEVFTSGCTQCGDCLDACEQNILVKDADGFVKVDFSLGECTFCRDCLLVCQQPLFRSTEEPAWFAHLNIKDNCLAKQNIYCQSCQDSCDTQAISFRYHSAIPTPQVAQADCTVCGACIAMCPSQSLELIALNQEVADD